MLVTLDTQLAFEGNETHIAVYEGECWDIDSTLVVLASSTAQAVIETAEALFPKLGKSVGRDAFLRIIIGHLNAQIGDPE